MPRILIVDDSEDLVEAYRGALTRKGFEVAVALDGEEGLRRSSDFQPDVIVLDMMMPELDGLEFLKRLAALEPSPFPRVIANSGFDSYRDEAMRRGAHAFLSKPVTLKILLAAIEAAVPGKPVPREHLETNQQEVAASREKSRTATAALIETLAEERMRPMTASLQALVEWLRRYYGFGECFLHLIDGDNVYLQASAGTDPKYLAPGMRYPKTNIYCGDVIDVGSTLYLSNPLRHPLRDFAEHNEVRTRGWHFYIGAPLATKAGTVLGTLCLMDRTPHDMHQEDIRLFEALASRIASMLAGVATGGPLEPSIVDVERVFRPDALDLLLGVALRRTARVRGHLRLARISVRDAADSTLVTRKAYGITSGLRFAIVSAPTPSQLVSLYDGSDRAIVDNNMQALERMIAPMISELQMLDWSSVEDDLPRDALQAAARRLLERLGLTVRA